jgi:hypothetical protein
MKCARKGTHQPINYDNQSVGYRMRESSQIMHFFAGSLCPRNRETPPRCTVARPGGLPERNALSNNWTTCVEARAESSDSGVRCAKRIRDKRSTNLFLTDVAPA